MGRFQQAGHCLLYTSIYRQTESGFGHESVARHWLKGRASRIGFQLVIAGNHPDLATGFDAYLRGPEYMPGGMQRNPHATQHHGLAILKCLNGCPTAHARPQQSLAGPRRQIRARVRACMVGMRVRDHGAIHRKPRIDVEIAVRAIESVARNL